MKGCLGASCPNSCCGVKEFRDYRGNTHLYRTTFLSPPQGEADFQAALDRDNPQLAALGVSVQWVTSRSGRPVALVNGCLGDEGCKLAGIGRKPLICRAYPYAIQNPGFPSSDCPAAQEITTDSDNKGLPALLRLVDEQIGLTRTFLAESFRARHRSS